jgi:DNA polymerase-3 subunit epsilon
VRFCAAHHDALVEELVALGLGAFVDVDDLDVVERRAMDAYWNGISLDNFDPYGLAAWQLHTGVLGLFGAEAIELVIDADLGYLVDPGVPIPAEATAVHGITDEDVAGKVGVDDAALFVAGVLDGVSGGRVPVAGMNVAFDLTVVRSSCERAGRPDGFAAPRRALDLFVLDKHVEKYRKGSRALGATCERYGVALDDAHQAEADVVASVRCILALVAEYRSLARLDLDRLTELQRAWRREQQRSLSAYFVKQGGEAIAQHEWEWPVMGALVEQLPL